MRTQHQTRVYTTLVLAACLFLFSASVSAQEPRAPSEYFRFTGLMALGCGAGQTTLTVTSLRSGTHPIGTLVTAVGKTFMDENATISTPGVVNHTWSFFSNNNRDGQTSTFPLPPNQPVTVESTMFSTDYEPQWRAVGSLTKCNNGVLAQAVEYKATELLYNNSFELISTGIDPASWTPNADAASTLSGVDCTLAFRGTCSLKINTQLALKTKYTQLWNGSVGKAGDSIELSLVQRLFGTYTGGGKVTVALTFANGATGKLQINATGAVNTAVWHFSNAKLQMPAALTSAKVTIKQKSAIAASWQIDGLSLAVFNFRGSTLAPLAAPSSPESSQNRGFDGTGSRLTTLDLPFNGD